MAAVAIRRPRAATTLCRATGFSLVEVIVVMLLLALVASVIAINVSRSLKSTQVRAVSRDLVAAMKYTRGQAIAKGKPKSIEFDLQNKTYQAPGRPRVSIPEGMELGLYTADSEIVDDDHAGIRFFSDGSSTGGRITLRYKDREWRINVNWLTGEIRVHQLKD
jgi:general secretion pathway protein H